MFTSIQHWKYDSHHMAHLLQTCVQRRYTNPIWPLKTNSPKYVFCIYSYIFSSVPTVTVLTMEWTNNLILEFLCLYEKYPEIWDPKNKFYRKRKVGSDAWRKIQKQLCVNVSVIDLKKKKESLMSTYRNIKKKNKDSGQSRMETNELYKPTWFAFHKMDCFLKSIGKVNQTCSEEDDIKNSTDAEYYSEDSDEEENTNNSREENTQKCNDAIGEGPEITRTSQKVNQNISQFNSPQPLQVKRKRETIDNENLEKCVSISILENLLSKSLEKQNDDDCFLYGQLLASKLRAMDARKRTIAMNQIDNLVFCFQIKD